MIIHIISLVRVRGARLSLRISFLFQNHLRPVVITGGNLGSSGGLQVLPYKSYNFDGIWFQRVHLTSTTLRLDNRLVNTGPTLPMVNHTAIL